ncbi:Uncharacterised protein [Cedecea neteri]|uniref:HTH cro/C1-type domain-containing protein n=1 Tax=Cedecea neteri TaxID=158822 RepID=A0A2X3IJR8_9ENTR|nr:helix-turn-helix transcriptional regulator [Cedecea neteri]SQC92562.1 Uncharacterised protein [Cedecea neteri]
MTERKESQLAFPGEGKESIAARLRQLIGNRSVRAAAQDWGLSFSTLNNYLSRGTEPSLNVALKIAQVEQVSMEWIATGVAAPASAKQVKSSKQENSLKTKDELRFAWLSAFEFMSDAEASALLRILISGGARGLIKSAELEKNWEEMFMSLTPELKERAIELVEAHVNAKKGASHGHSIDESIDLQADNKKAG